MNNKVKIASHLLDYLKLKVSDFTYEKRGKVRMLSCPVCNMKPLSASFMPLLNKIHCAHCSKDYVLIDIVKHLEPDKAEWDENQILEYVRDLLKLDIQTDNELDKLLTYYNENNWSLIPVVKKSKIPVERAWTERTHYDRIEWENWVECGSNLGARTGKMSNITVIDLDVIETALKKKFRANKMSENEKEDVLKLREKNLQEVLDKLKNFLNETLTLTNLGGRQYIYEYDPDIFKTSFNWENIHIDIQNDGGYILIPPSRVGISFRKFQSLRPIAKMCPELKQWVLDNSTPAGKDVLDEKIKIAIADEDLKINPKDFQLRDKGLNGCCNNAMIALWGKIRHHTSAKTAEIIIRIINKHMLKSPLDEKSIRAMSREITKYIESDEYDLLDNILEYLKLKDFASEAEIEMAALGERAKGEVKSNFAKALQQLQSDNKITKRGKVYKIIEDMDWQTSITNIQVPIDFNMPYLNDYAQLYWGNLAILGSQNKYGKTTLAMNIIKKLVHQGKKPYYIYNEKMSGWSDTAMTLGMKDDDFYNVMCTDPETISLRENSIVIYDWVMPEDFARTDKLFQYLVQTTEKTNSFMICFVQLKEDDTFFAPNQIGQFPAVLFRYVWDEPDNGEYTHFQLDRVRKPKRKVTIRNIPCKYIFDTREVKTLEELDKEKNND